MKTALKTKTKALSRVPQSREDAVWAIGRIGALRREIAARKAEADEAARKIGEKLESNIAAAAAELAEHEKGVQTWCEANRLALTNDGKVKFHEFGTGRVNWRSRPPKVSIRGVEAVIEAVKALGLKGKFLRVKEELNKDAMLADADTARKIAGVTISSEGEDFVIEPLELEAAGA
ncbi:host-nuclease inhibitor Gam family protein [Ensifer sp. NBAIM29]|nr:host-nuclease inhibitor Gam family protein [Ensifer sp. NBAIM29]